MEIPPKIKNGSASWSSDTSSGNISEGTQSTYLTEYKHPCVHCSIIYNCHDIEAAQVPKVFQHFISQCLPESSIHGIVCSMAPVYTHTHTHTHTEFRLSCIQQVLIENTLYILKMNQWIEWSPCINEAYILLGTRQSKWANKTYDTILGLKRGLEKQ